MVILLKILNNNNTPSTPHPPMFYPGLYFCKLEVCVNFLHCFLIKPSFYNWGMDLV